MFCGVDRAAMHAMAGWKPRMPWHAPRHEMKAGEDHPFRSERKRRRQTQV
jgi:hypothetical protein